MEIPSIDKTASLGLLTEAARLAALNESKEKETVIKKIFEATLVRDYQRSCYFMLKTGKPFGYEPGKTFSWDTYQSGFTSLKNQKTAELFTLLKNIEGERDFYTNRVSKLGS